MRSSYSVEMEEIITVFGADLAVHNNLHGLTNDPNSIATVHPITGKFKTAFKLQEFKVEFCFWESFRVLLAQFSSGYSFMDIKLKVSFPYLFPMKMVVSSAQRRRYCSKIMAIYYFIIKDRDIGCQGACVISMGESQITLHMLTYSDPLGNSKSFMRCGKLSVGQGVTIGLVVLLRVILKK